MAITFDEELWFGTADDSAAEEKAAKSMAALAGRVEGARPFPRSARELLDLTSGAQYSVPKAVAIIEGDAGLGGRVMRLVNSSGYGLRIPCRTVRHAVTLLGASRLRDIATAAGVLELFPDESEETYAILHHSTIVAALARHFGGEFGLAPEEAFTCAFLHDIGQLMMLHEQEGYAEIFAAAAGEADVLYKLERERYGFDHAVLAGHVLAAWHIPKPLPKVVAWHHNPAKALRAGGQIASMVSVLRLADRLAHELGKPIEAVDLEGIASTDAAAFLGVSAQRLEIMWNELEAIARGVRGDVGYQAEESQTAEPRARPSVPVKHHGQASMRPTVVTCAVCAKPSFGEACLRCGSYVCDEHTLDRNRVCALCEREYQDIARTHAAPPYVRAIGVLLFGLAALAAGIVTASGPGRAGVEQFWKPMLAVSCAALLLFAFALVYRRWSMRAAFVAEKHPRAPHPKGA